jgi:hypothetical protein
MRRKALVALAAGVLVSNAVWAKEEPGQWYVAPMASVIWPDNSRAVDDDVGGHIAVGRAMGEAWNLEAGAYYYDLSGYDDTTMWGVDLSAMAVFYRNNRISPFLLGAYGFIDKDRDEGDSDKNSAATLAFGFLTDLGPTNGGIALRTELRWRLDFQDSTDSTEQDLMLNIGAQFPFGAPDR